MDKSETKLVFHKKTVADSKVNEVVKLLPEKCMVADIQRAFSTLDYTVTGTLGPRDIKVTLRGLGIEPTATNVKKLMERSSTDKQSKLSREEYECMIENVLNDIDSEEQMMKSFKQFDADNKEYLIFKDLKKIAKQLQLDIANEEIQEMINFADVDKDGKVILKEFIDAARKIF